MTSRTKAELLLVSITLIWGSTFVITKEILRSLPPFLYTALRFLLATLIFGLWHLKSIRSMNRSSFLKGAGLGLLLFIGFSLQTVGLQYTTASKSAFITGLLVILTPMCQILIERRAPKIGNVIGVILVAVGLYLLTSPRGSEMNVGDLMTIGCALCFALYIVYLDVFSNDSDPVQLTVAQFLVSAIGGIVGSLLLEPFPSVFPIQALVGLLYLTIFATVIALYVQVKYQRESTPTRAAVIFALEPVVAAIAAYLVLGEIIGTAGVIGGGIIVAGLLVSELSDFLFSGSKTNGGSILQKDA
ncbi:MAG TPA: DMT family transporter [Bacteroidota bacterium]|nr:DMT family transporter [Bacteroidota bacterium]